MTKRLLSIAAVLAFALTVTACGGKSGGGEKNGESAPQGASSSASASASASDAGDEGGKKYDGVTVRIGVQGKGGLFGKAQEARWFEDAFEAVGAKVQWFEFQSGPPEVEAMASDHLDFAGMGNMPPVAAQSAGVDFKIISQVLQGTNNVAIIVPKDSAIQSIADLKGKKVAVTKGSNAFNFLYRVLDKEGIKDSDLQIIQLAPDETQPSFEAGKVDAWAVWDPYITLNTLTGKARVLADGQSTGILSPSFQLVRGGFAKEYPELVTLYLKVQEQARLWEESHKDEALQRYADERKVPVDVMKGVQERSKTINTPVSDETIADQQKTADFQYAIGTIKNKIDVSQVFDNQYITEALKQSAAEAAK